MLVYQMVTPNIKFTGTHLYMYIWVEFTQPILWISIPVEIYLELQCVYDSAVLLFFKCLILFLWNMSTP